MTLPVTSILALSGSIKWNNRLGYLPEQINTHNKKVIWLHASSMGEVKVLAILKDFFEKADNTISIYITVMTEAGYQSACQLVKNKDQVAFFPLDATPAVNRFLNRIQPKTAVFIETEIWPNMIDKLGKRNIPIFLANGRLSEKSSRSYIHFKKSLGQLFENYNRLMVQSENDKDRYIKIGANKNKIEVIGNLKLDATSNIIPNDQKDQIKNCLPFDKESKLLIAGSTRKEENEIIIRLFKNLTEKFSDICLILAPRHLEKISEAEKLARKYNLSSVLYSECKNIKQTVSAVIVDKMGLLNQLYSVSDIAFVGGTLADIGGQNILEPVWAGTPVLYGPSIYNVGDSSKYILGNRFGAMVQDENELYDKLVMFFNNELSFSKKDETSSEKSHTEKTAQIILDNL